ncbi:uncharacterized protein ACA1_384800 [Acanthamoeba castellanii str. Neff]|uniref:Glycosyltransferase 61 catalytic domain-containing protein n=1 Tax=Acanthamoeba castellanii (strain ATCC 30010 / Neff) TaxID=1257118 RepID=L8H8B6_ACACF|nr:uncharacterized protein ACA1_384800 [Acanthamoeba castellanii str. Neff]ELR21744.1 hypothetical protein ACA1_384800 [Acanthamoeba castellanii str. Neff]
MGCSFKRVALALVLFHQLLLFLYFMGVLDLNSDQPAPQPLSTPTTPGLSRSKGMTERRPVVCHPEVCEGMCDEACGQTPKITRECRGDECRAEHPQLIHKVELSYPAFTMRMPSFVDPELEALFLSVGAVKNTYMVEHGQCPSPQAREGENRCEIIGAFNKSRELVFTHARYIYGEIAVIKDGVWSGKPDDTFGQFECWEKADFRWIAQGKAAAKRPTKSFKKAVVMLTPVTGGAYYQHFIDRGWSKLIQAWILVSPGFKRHPNVERLWERFGMKDRLVYVNPKDTVYAEERAQRRLGVDPDVPLDKRKKIVYFTRKGKSRQVLNEDELVAGIRTWLKDNKRPEELLVFESEDWPDLDKLIHFFNQEVVAVVGPHGGAFYNALFCARKTLVIEFFPISMRGDAYRWPECIWWPSHFLGFRYYQVPIRTKSAAVNVQPHLVTDILRHELPHAPPSS